MYIASRALLVSSLGLAAFALAACSGASDSCDPQQSDCSSADPTDNPTPGRNNPRTPSPGGPAETPARPPVQGSILNLAPTQSPGSGSLTPMSAQTFAVVDGLDSRVAQVGSAASSAAPRLAAGNPEVEAALTNLFIAWNTDNNVFRNAFGIHLCDSGIAFFQQNRNTELGVDTLTEQFSFLGFWTADFESNTELTLRTQFLTSNDADQPPPFLQDFSIGLTRPPTMDGIPIANIEDESTGCAGFVSGLEQQCRGNTAPFCRELANRSNGVVIGLPPPPPAPPPPPPPAPEPAQCSALPNPANACAECAAGACCGEISACGAGTPCDAVLTCLSVCPDLDASCAQRSCAPISQQGLDAAVALGQCLQADCSAECN
jgi:hypothetical protein